ncbi:MAG: LysR family transcriptional regulator [Clostridium fessum]
MYIKNPEYFITTVREGSISKAAEKLYLSQPYLKASVSHEPKRGKLRRQALRSQPYAAQTN